MGSISSPPGGGGGGMPRLEKFGDTIGGAAAGTAFRFSGVTGDGFEWGEGERGAAGAGEW